MQARRRYKILTIIHKGESLYDRVKAEEIFKLEPLLIRVPGRVATYALNPEGQQERVRLAQELRRSGRKAA
jgi:hypothetical protein